MDKIAASIAKAELGSLFLNSQEVVKVCLALEKLGCSQLPTLVHINNTTAFDITYQIINEQRSHVMNLR